MDPAHQPLQRDGDYVPGRVLRTDEAEPLTQAGSLRRPLEFADTPPPQHEVSSDTAAAGDPEPHGGAPGPPFRWVAAASH